MFGGVTQSMRNVLQDNKKLTLKGKNRKLKLGESSVSASKISTPAASPIILETIRTKTLRYNKLRKKLLLILAITFTLIFLMFFIPLFENNVNQVNINQSKLDRLKLETEQLIFYTDDAKYWLSQSHFENASIQFWNAIQLNPSDEKLWIPYLYTIKESCLTRNLNCDKEVFSKSILGKIPTVFRNNSFFENLVLYGLID